MNFLSNFLRKKQNGLRVLCILSIALVASYPVMFMYFNNITQLRFIEIFKPIIFLLCIATFVCGSTFVYTRNIGKSAVITALIMLIFNNYGYLEKGIQLLAPRVKYWHIVPVLLFCIVWLAIIIKRNYQNEVIIDILKVMLLTFSVLLLVNVVPALFSLGQIQSSVDDINQEESNLDSIEPSKLPNVYWLIFDEYSNNEVLKSYFDYDNSAFENKLRDKGFYVANNSYNNSATTTTVLTNYINGDYVASDEMTEADKQKLRYKVQLLKDVEQLGYDTKFIGQTDFFGLPSELGNTSQSKEARTVSGDTLFTLILKNTLIGNWIQENNDEDIELVLDTLAYLKMPQVDNGNFIFSYLCSPHQPFYFNADGSFNDLTNLHNWEEKEYYLGQYLFVSSQIEEIVNEILAQDPECIILIQSDHAARYLAESGELIIPPTERCHIFNAVYYKGEDMSCIENMDGVNTVNIIFDKIVEEAIR